MAAPLADLAVRRIAIVRLRLGLGDLLCTTPALRRLRQARPDVVVSLVTWRQTRPVVKRMRALVDELLPFPGVAGIPDRPVGRTPDPRRWPAFLAAARRRHFDLALQMYGDRVAANEVTAALGARLTGGFAPTGWQPPPGTEALHLRYPLHAHEADRHRLLFERMGVPAGPPTPLEFPITAGDDAERARISAAAELIPGEYVVLHPGASAASRRWPVERYAEVGDALAAEGWTIALTGVPDERWITAAVRAQMRAPVVDLTGATTLGGLAALLRDSAALISNDTGSAHLAAAVGAPTVTVFLAGDPTRWAHRGPARRAVVATAPCAPCPHLTCPIDFRCAASVRAATVVRAVHEVIRKKAA